MKFVTYKGIKVPIDPPLRGGALIGSKVGAWVDGINSQIIYEITRPSADWRDLIFLPEKQYFDVGDTFACTNFANCNSAKLQLKNSTGEEYDFSESADAELSGTQAGVGNYMDAPPEQTRKNGRILAKDHPNGNSVQEFYRPVTKEEQTKAIRFKEGYTFVDVNSLKYHLKQAPVTIMIKAGDSNHDVTAVYADSNGIWYMDSYPHNTADNYLAITTQVPQFALKIIVKPMNTIIFVHKKGTTEYGLLVVSPVGQTYTPASTEDDLKARGGISVPLTPDGKVDYSKAREIDLP